MTNRRKPKTRDKAHSSGILSTANSMLERPGLPLVRDRHSKTAEPWYHTTRRYFITSRSNAYRAGATDNTKWETISVNKVLDGMWMETDIAYFKFLIML